jgi:hypothetical protein
VLVLLVVLEATPHLQVSLQLPQSVVVVAEHPQLTPNMQLAVVIMLFIGGIRVLQRRVCSQVVVHHLVLWAVPPVLVTLEVLVLVLVKGDYWIPVQAVAVHGVMVVMVMLRMQLQIRLPLIQVVVVEVQMVLLLQVERGTAKFIGQNRRIIC